MPDTLQFFLIWAVGAAATMVVVMAPGWAFAGLTRPFHARLFPLAHKIAGSMRRERGAWNYEPHKMTATHGASGLEVYIGLGGWTQVRVKTNIGYWSPNLIEREMVASAFNALARDEARRAADLHMRPGAQGERQLLGQEVPKDDLSMGGRDR